MAERCWRNFLTLLCGVFFLVSCSRSGLNPGANAPSFTLSSIKGGEVSLSDFRGKAVLLNFWATWCTPCIDELPSLKELSIRMKGKPFAVVAIAVRDDRESVLEIREDLGLDFTILLDNDGRVASAYKVTGFPETWLLDSTGRVRMFSDPENEVPVVKAVGPRNWSTPQVIRILEAVLPQG